MALAFAALVVLVHSRSLGGTWTFDDHRFIAMNPWVVAPDSWLRSFTDMATTDPASAAGIVRPLRTLEFAADSALLGLRPWAFRLHSLLWFAAGGTFLWLLLRELLGDARAALAGAVLWLVHPMQTEVADLISSRGDAASGAMVLLAAWTALRADDGRSGRGLSLAAAACAMLYKESGVVAPLLIVLLCMARGLALADALRRTLPWFGVAAAYVAYWSWVRVGEASHVAEAPLGGTNVAAFATMARGAGAYVAFALLPVRPALDWYLPVVRSFAEGGAFVWAIGAACGVAWGAVAVVRGTGARRIAGAAVLWFAVALLPVSNWPVCLGIPTAERFLHVALVGVALLVALAVRTTPRALPAVAAGAVACAAISFQRAADWRDDRALVGATLRTVESPRAAGMEAGRLRGEGLDLRASDPAAAAAKFDAALGLTHGGLQILADFEGTPHPRQHLAATLHSNASNLCWLLGRHGEALFHAEEALRVQEDAHFGAHFARAAALLEFDRGAAALTSLRRALALGYTPDAEIRGMLVRAAQFCDRDGETGLAAAALADAAALPVPDDGATARTARAYAESVASRLRSDDPGIAIALAAAGRLAEADRLRWSGVAWIRARYFARGTPDGWRATLDALRGLPESEETLFLEARAREELVEDDLALAAFRRFLAANPQDPERVRRARASVGRLERRCPALPVVR